MNEPLAFGIFVAIFCGGLAAVTLGMVWIAAVLIRRNRAHRETARRRSNPSGRTETGRRA